MVAVSIPDATFFELWRTPKWFGYDAALVAVSSLAVFAVGFGIAYAIREKTDYPTSIDPSRLTRISNVFFLLTLAGYLVWAALAISRGFSLSFAVDVLAGERGAVYTARNEYLMTVPGLTTLTQFGPVFALLAVYIGHTQGWKRTRMKLAIIILFAFIRAFFYSERLALIEIFVPVSVLSLAFFTKRWKRPPLMIRLAPLALGSLGIAAFGVFEYFRSWINFYVYHGPSFWEFIFQRIAGYYVTALNNGAMLFGHLSSGLGVPYYTLIWLWKFPGLSGVISYASVTGLQVEQLYSSLLATLGNPEFNNPSGIFVPFVDLGLGGGMVMWGLFGVITGRLYRSFVRHRPYGLFFYPVWIMGLLDMSRILYWTSTRTFPIWVGLYFAVTYGLQRKPSLAGRDVVSGHEDRI